MNSKKKLFQKGLTLTELMIVVGILSFLILFALWYFRGQILKGNDAKRKGDIHRIQVAVEEYEKDNNCYPLPQLVDCSPGDGLQPYMNKIPCDPTTGSSYLYQIEDSGCPQWYRVLANLENQNDPDALVSCGPNGTYDYYASSPNAPECQITDSDFYGCFDGTCLPIGWDESRPGPECDPNYQNPTCYGQCGPPETECEPWNQ